MTELEPLIMMAALGAACLGWAMHGFRGAIGAAGFVIALVAIVAASLLVAP